MSSDADFAVWFPSCERLASPRLRVLCIPNAGSSESIFTSRETGIGRANNRLTSWASANGVPVVPRGAGSGLAGAANAVDGAVVMSLAAMNRVLEVNPADRYVVVQPGAVTATEIGQSERW